MTGHAPIALFAYNRPAHVRRTVEALQANALAPESRLFVFADGARDAAVRPGVAETRAYLRSITGFKSITLVEREENLGLAGSIVAGVTQLAAEHGRVIVLEDDLVTSPHFLRFMNDALAMYADDDRVMHVSGGGYPIGEGITDHSYFLRVPLCWGWGTWQRAWRHFSADLGQMTRFDADMVRRFDFDGTYGYWRQMEQNRRGQIRTWFIFWYANLFLRNGLALFPGRSLVNNIGMDGSGVHCTATRVYDVDPSADPVPLARIAIEESAQAAELHEQYFRRIRPPAHVRLLEALSDAWQGARR